MMIILFQTPQVPLNNHIVTTLQLPVNNSYYINSFRRQLQIFQENEKIIW